MNVIEARNVNEAYWKGLHTLMKHGVRSQSRNGPVLVAPWPVSTVYLSPTERVLFNRKRDANPFFHMMEAIWMLAGRDDAAFLTRYAKQIGEYAERNGKIHGAYGKRWRRGFGFDQLRVVVERLRANRDDRQAVIAMWDPMTAVPGHLDLTAAGLKDRPCNTHVYLRVRDQKPSTVPGAPFFNDIAAINSHVLDITVCCRSNDAIWGCYGANAVHFSFLQEYLAAELGVQVGRYYQISNNFHAYDNELLARCTSDLADDTFSRYENSDVSATPIVTDAARFLSDCESFCLAIDCMWLKDDFEGPPFHNVWFNTTAWNAALAHWYYKKDDLPMARRAIAAIVADDWRLACAEWIDRRVA